MYLILRLLVCVLWKRQVGTVGLRKGMVALEPGAAAFGEWRPGRRRGDGVRARPGSRAYCRGVEGTEKDA